MNSLADSEN